MTTKRETLIQGPGTTSGSVAVISLTVAPGLWNGLVGGMQKQPGTLG